LPSSTSVGDSPLYDNASADALRELIAAEHLHVYESVASTMDIAHDLARSGAPDGTIILADTQSAGRGRSGAPWVSEPGQGVWMSIIERPTDPSALHVLSLRVGLGAARALDLFADEPVRIKWPNDLFTNDKKLGGILIEARWRDLDLEWVVIGLGVNVSPPAGIDAASLEPGTSRIDVLADLIPEVRAAAAMTGVLDATEMSEFEGRDFARGKRCTEPAIGTAKGITSSGELLVALADSTVKFRSGSLVLDASAPALDLPATSITDSNQGAHAQRLR
jgi:BirA family transcriptional regulator, biotin operon repressor / biotin---[acetyl-CoA-carboxylase] ligase